MMLKSRDTTFRSVSDVFQMPAVQKAVVAELSCAERKDFASLICIIFHEVFFVFCSFYFRRNYNMDFYETEMSFSFLFVYWKVEMDIIYTCRLHFFRDEM